MTFNTEGTEDEGEARERSSDNSTPLTTLYADNPHEANDDCTYDSTYPSVPHEQFIRTNTSKFENLLAVLDADTRGGSSICRRVRMNWTTHILGTAFGKIQNLQGQTRERYPTIKETIR
jgi:hypothetical protein